MPKHLMLLFLMVFTQHINAQNKFLQGYIVTTAQDTIQGFIETKTSPERVTNIVFKKQMTDKTVEQHTANSILSFYLQQADAYFISEEVKMDKKTTNITALESNSTPHYVTETVFLKVLTKGKANLLYYADENFKKHYFIQKDSQEIVELEYIVYSKGDNRFVEVQKYVEQLRNLLVECEKIKIYNLNFSERSFKNIVEKYNTCTGTGKNYVNTNKTKYLEFSAWAGVSNGVANLVGNNRITTFLATPPQNITFDPSLNSVIGLSLKIKPQFLPRFVFLNVDAMYFKHNFKTAEKFSDIENYNLNIGFSYLSFTPSLGIILNGKIKPYIKLGGHFTIQYNPQ